MPRSRGATRPTRPYDGKSATCPDVVRNEVFFLFFNVYPRSSFASDPDLVCDGRVSLGCPNFEIPNVERFWNTSEFDSAEKLSIFVLLLGKNDTCFRRISRLMCLIDMPLCDASSPEPRPLSVCREYCESLTDDVCAKHWKWIEETIKENPKFSLSLLPKCDEFPSQYDEESFECIVEEKMPPKEEEFTKGSISSLIRIQL